jgi:ABC-type cobalamin/Fe3+-siderophores transport system ATPase subunit
MRLTALRVRGYRPLEDVSLEALSHFNVLVGRNNAGKSSILRAVQHLAVAGTGAAGEDGEVLTDAKANLALQFSLEFELDDVERDWFVQKVGDRPRSHQRLLASTFARQIRIHIDSAPGAPQTLFVRGMELLAEDDWAEVLMATRPIGEAAEYSAFQWANAAVVERRGNGLTTMTLGPRGGSHASTGGPQNLVQWLRAGPPGPWLRDYLQRSFFLSPFRHAQDELGVQETVALAADGSNLPQLLHTIQSNDPEKFRRIEGMVQAAIPDIGTLVTPLRQSLTHAGFRQSNRVIRIRDMGTGVEELLMVAGILETVPDANLFLEEPEGHLHPGAQRYLMDLLRARAHQSFIATHSPVFLSGSVDTRVFQVALTRKRTVVHAAPDAAGFDEILREIGSRNSDLLLSDAVLFVEGPSDSVVLRALSGAAGTPLLLSRVTLLPLGGSDTPLPKARARTEVLEGISNRTPIPHMFLLDRDERSTGALAALASLGDRVVILQRRELENYLLVPKAIRLAMVEKFEQATGALSKVANLTDADIALAIQRHAADLYGHVLVKRIRAELGGLAGGLVERAAIEGLARDATKARLAAAIRAHIRSRLDPLMNAKVLADTVDKARKKLDREWARKEAPRKLAPGADILARLYRDVGGSYDKARDGERIARNLTKGDIAEELLEILKRASSLPE